MKYYFAFDLDGTVTKKEILPLIAKEIGIQKEMAILTKKTMAGEIPFDQSFKKRVNMLKKVPINKVQEIVKNIKLSNPILHFMQKNRNRCYIVTQNLDVWVELLLKKIGIPALTSKADYKGNRLIGIKKILRKNIIHRKVDYPVVVIGEGYNDLEMMIDAPISIAFGGIHKPADPVLEVVDYAIYDENQLCRFLKQLL
jgi:HAD superfamily phosphoserine phosphatase-like hydrolase